MIYRRRRTGAISLAWFWLVLTVLSVWRLEASTLVHLSWDANTEPDLAGYRIEYGTVSGNYSTILDVGNVTSYDIASLPATTTFYFAVVAYDLAGNVSGPSNEVATQPTVFLPQLQVSSTDSPDPVAAGGSITYTISYANTGNADASGVVISDTLPANTTFVSASASGSLSGSVVTWSIGGLAAGASGSVQLVVRVATPLANGTVITNGAYSVDSNETPATSGAADTTTVNSMPVLAVSSVDSPDPVAAGGNITYTISYANTGNANASGVTVSDTIPANTTFVSAAGGATPTGGIVTWSIGGLAAGVSGSVQMVVRANSPLANGTVITNGTYNVDSNETPATNGAADMTTITSTPVLTISGTDSPDPVAAGGNVTYTLSYGNTGNANASGVVIADSIPANTTFVSATAGGTLSGSTVTWSIGAVAAGASGSVQMVVRVASPLANGTVITNGTYNVDSNETAAANGAAVTTTVTSAPVLTISGTDAPDPVAAGGNITYTIAYANTGNANASGVVVIDAVPANTTFVSATGGGTLSGSTVTWSIGALAAGASGSVQMVVRVASPLANGTVITNGTYNIDSNETAAANGAAVTTTVTSAPVLTISGTDSPDPVVAGGNVTYTIAYANTGSANASGVIVIDAVPANTTFVSATGGGALSGSTVTWSIGTLAAGASGSVQMVVRVASPLANGTVITNGTYSVDSNETAATNGAAVTTTVTSAPMLTISATDSPDPVNQGSTITYTLNYSNSGNSSASGVVITDTIPSNTTFVSATAGGTLSGSTVTWSTGGLASGASGSVQLVVSVTSPLANGTVITNGSYSIDSIETAPANGPAITTTTVNTSQGPTINSAVEATTGSIYIVQSGGQSIQVKGSGFQPGAILSFGPDIAVGSTTFVDATLITAAITIGANAALGPHAMTVTNPDFGSVTSSGPLSVSKDPDFGGNCVVGGNDLNVMARAWNTTPTDAAYDARADLDGDNYVGPDDLVILSLYFGRKHALCP